ncbi:Uncharacterised protein [uncultured archaeon]|nr:Uncharacterised protein [uncultured archaeon]
MQFRKVIHISGVLIPAFAVVDFPGRNLTVGLLVFGLAVYLFLEAAKPKINPSILSLVYRDNEIKAFAVEPLSYIISVLSLLSLSFFIDEKLCFAAIAVLAAGDGVAGVIGRRYGRHRLFFNKDKSWEGSTSGFIAAVLAGLFYAGPIAIVGAAFGMLAGAVNRHDNIAVPFAALISMAMVQWLAFMI